MHQPLGGETSLLYGQEVSPPNDQCGLAINQGGIPAQWLEGLPAQWSVCIGHQSARTPQPMTSSSPHPMAEKLARMAASEFLLDAAIRFKLGRAPPSELLTHSNSAARAFGHRV
ncbi:hypothetical protein PCANC_05038 [Puccinia coronata f. sp. avenae]|uniref:Uncharacterized protein n=1 Tax=Puccinia coronata f. sp. avenae TaxID=200324 RepID=A0A2N5T727_9BASI|nr:hypothetical protein PCANC_05038 [Puccinia coronata f. sp. avenae]